MMLFIACYWALFFVCTQNNHASSNPKYIPFLEVYTDSIRHVGCSKTRYYYPDWKIIQWVCRFFFFRETCLLLLTRVRVHFKTSHDVCMSLAEYIVDFKTTIFLHQSISIEDTSLSLGVLQLDFSQKVCVICYCLSCVTCSFQGFS